MYEQLMEHYRDEHLRQVEQRGRHREALRDLEHEQHCRCRCHSNHSAGTKHPGRPGLRQLFRRPRGA